MTPRTRRVWVTAGATGWAREPHDTEHEETTTPMTDHTLTPADVAARCRILECGVVVAGGNYKITPPAGATTEDGSRPSVVHIPADPDFRSKADRALSLRNLRHNGVDVLADRDWSGKAETPTADEPEIPKLEIQGPRPVAAWTKVPAPDESDEPDVEITRELEVTRADLDRSDEIVSALGAELARIVAPIAEDLAKLAARVGNLESGPRAVASSATHARRLTQLDESVGSLSRRVAHLETTVDSVTQQSATSADTVAAMGTKVSGNAARATNLGAELNSVRARLDALETAAGTTTEDAWIDELRSRITDVLSRFRGLDVYIPRATIAEAAGLPAATDDAGAKRLSYVLKVMREEGLIESIGARSSTRWRLVQDETPEGTR